MSAGPWAGSGKNGVLIQQAGGARQRILMRVGVGGGEVWGGTEGSEVGARLMILMGWWGGRGGQGYNLLAPHATDSWACGCCVSSLLCSAGRSACTQAIK